jgi:hypothetical protein
MYLRVLIWLISDNFFFYYVSFFLFDSFNLDFKDAYKWSGDVGQIT